MTQRKAGWYWVKTDYQSEWEAAQFDGDDWHVTRAGQEWSESMLDKVGGRIPTPDEPWQCVPIEATQDMTYQVAISDGTTDEDDINSGMCCAAWDWVLMLGHAPKPDDL